MHWGARGGRRLCGALVERDHEKVGDAHSKGTARGALGLNLQHGTPRLLTQGRWIHRGILEGPRPMNELQIQVGYPKLIQVGAVLCQRAVEAEEFP